MTSDPARAQRSVRRVRRNTHDPITSSLVGRWRGTTRRPIDRRPPTSCPRLEPRSRPRPRGRSRPGQPDPGEGATRIVVMGVPFTCPEPSRGGRRSALGPLRTRSPRVRSMLLTAAASGQCRSLAAYDSPALPSPGKLVRDGAPRRCPVCGGSTPWYVEQQPSPCRSRPHVTGRLRSTLPATRATLPRARRPAG